MGNSGKIKIVSDRNIPYIKDALDLLDQCCEVLYLPGDHITPEVMSDIDILLTRTRTRCDRRLLDHSRCSLIATATIGTDHIDLDYCRSRGITVANAPGCNAPAVAQYVLASISSRLLPGETFASKRLGIIGVGNVGSILSRWARGLGMSVLLNDPPKTAADPSLKGYCDLSRIAEEADIISVHTPLTRNGAFPTYHLIDNSFLDSTRRKPFIINAARGEVTDTTALKRHLKSGKISGVAIDCWEGEPDIDTSLLQQAAIATPHIAGYSAEGKIRATKMILSALITHLRQQFGINEISSDQLLSTLPAIGETPEIITPDMLRYDIAADTRDLKSASDTATTFERLRNNYPLRSEPTHD